MTAFARNATPHLTPGLRAPTPEPHRLREALAALRPEPGLLNGITDGGAIQTQIFAAAEAGALSRLSDTVMRHGAAVFLSPPRPIGRDVVAGQAFLLEAERRRGRVSTNLLAAYFAGFRSDDPDVQRLARFLERDMPEWRFFSADFWRQRVTAVAMVLLILPVIVVVMLLLGRNQAGAAQILGSPPVAIILLLFIIASVWHMKIGMQIVIEDYVHSETLKLVAIMANNFFSILVALTSIYAILKLSSGV